MRHAFGVLLCAFPLIAQPLIDTGRLEQPGISFPNFHQTSQLQLVSDARIVGKVARIAPAKNNRRGAVWFRDPQPVAAGFTTTFEFRLTDQDRSGFNGADGLAFVIQGYGPDAIGGHGHASGFMLADPQNSSTRGIPRSLALFFDTHKNHEHQDPSDNYAVLCLNGDGYWPARKLALADNLRVKLEDGKGHLVRIDYRPPHLDVQLDGDPILHAAIDMASVTGPDGKAWVGFTAATGGGYQNHDLLNWKMGPAEGVDSNMSVVSTTISYMMKYSCLPNRALCTPERAIVEATGDGRLHVILPANQEWPVAIPNPEGVAVRVENASGLVCWDPSLGQASCNGPGGSQEARRAGTLLQPASRAASLIMTTRNGQTYFSVNDHSGQAFHDNEGMFEFYVTLDSPLLR